MRPHLLRCLFAESTGALVRGRVGPGGKSLHLLQRQAFYIMISNQNPTIIELLTESAQRGNPSPKRFSPMTTRRSAFTTATVFWAQQTQLKPPNRIEKRWSGSESRRARKHKHQYKLGLHYRAGNGVQKSAEKAAEWFQKATREERRTLNITSASATLFGEGIIRDDEEAFKWFRKSAKAIIC